MRGHRLGKAFIHPATPLQSPFHRAFTRLKTLPMQVVDQQIRATTRFEIAIITRMLGQHRLQDHQSLVLLAIGASRGRGIPEPLDTILDVGFEPTTDRMFMAPDGLGNHRNALTAIREQDRQAAFCQVGGTDAARFFVGALWDWRAQSR